MPSHHFTFLQLSATVRAGTCSFNEMFCHAAVPLAIDTYQRGFVWDDARIRQLLDDLVQYRRHKEKDPSLPHYYMGTVLLHGSREKDRLFIIDGQQRLSALCVLHHVLSGEIPRYSDMQYAPASANHLREAARCLESANQLLDPAIFDEIHFSVVQVPTLDLAFAFFDTQNNRGVPLYATDLLKAFHLRAIEGPNMHRIQTDCAAQWERVQRSQPVLGSGKDAAPSLFSRFLWRARAWQGQHGLEFETHDALMAEFQENCLRRLPTDPENAVDLYPARGNVLNTRLAPDAEGKLAPHENTERRSHCEPEELPFAVRQPINAGLGFFLYTSKYAALLQKLADSAGASRDVERYLDFYRTVVRPLSDYLHGAYLLCVLMYVDRFGCRQLHEFALWLDYVVGSLRIEKEQVRKETALNFFSRRNRNLLDVIAGAFTPGQVIHLLRSDAHADGVYAAEKVDAGKGVQGRYKENVLAYYKQERKASLKGRRDWIPVCLGRQTQAEAP